MLRQVTIEEEGEVDLGELALPPGASIAGRVVDPAGEPVAGAQVEVVDGLPRGPDRQPPQATTAADGGFVIADLPAGERFGLRASAEGWVDATAAGIAAPPEEPVELVLEQGGRVFGRVIDGAGEPVRERFLFVRPAAEERLSRGPVRQEAPSDEEGGFDLAGIPPGTHLLQVHAPGAGRPVTHGPFEVAAGQEVGPVEIVVGSETEEIRVSGTVLRPDGRPAIGAQVELRASDGFRNSQPTGGAGRFELGASQPGPATLTARHPEHGWTEREITLAPGMVPVELRLSPGARVTGRVVDPQGAPVAEARVILQPDGTRRGSGLAAYSDAGGSFEISGVYPGSYHLGADADGWLPWRSPESFALAEGDSRDVQVELEAGAVLIRADRRARAS